MLPTSVTPFTATPLTVAPFTAFYKMKESKCVKVPLHCSGCTESVQLLYQQCLTVICVDMSKVDWRLPLFPHFRRITPLPICNATEIHLAYLKKYFAVVLIEIIME